MNQMEMFEQEPFSVRLTIEVAMGIFIENYWKFLPSYSKTKAHQRRIMEFFKGRFIDTIHKQDIENYRRYLKEMGLVEQTVNKGHVMLSRMFSKLQEYKEAGEVNGMDFRHVQIPDINPCRLVPKVDETKFSRRQTVSEQQWQKLIYYSDDDMKENLIMYLDTGLRPSDVHRLTDYNVDLKNMTLRGVQHNDAEPHRRTLRPTDDETRLQHPPGPLGEDETRGLPVSNAKLSEEMAESERASGTFTYSKKGFTAHKRDFPFRPWNGRSNRC
jgi:integrase